MPIHLTFYIRKNATGEVRQYADDSAWDETDPDYPGEDLPGASFMWTDGNYACDCNRHLFFCRAVGEDEEKDEPKCGSEVYSLVKVVDEHGRDRSAAFPEIADAVNSRSFACARDRA